MRCVRLILSLAFLAFVVSSSGAEEIEIKLPFVAGYALSPDSKTLVVAIPSKTELVFIDVATGKEIKKEEVEFQPTRIAWQEKTLYVAQNGAGIVHVLNSDNCKELGSFKVGSTVRNIVCHKSKGNAFVTNQDSELHFVTRKAKGGKLTGLKATCVAIDPVEGNILYVAYEGPSEKTFRGLAVPSANLNKYVIEPKSIRSVAEIKAVTRAWLCGVYVSPDGKMVTVVSNGGYMDKANKFHGTHPFFATDDFTTMIGEFGTPGTWATLAPNTTENQLAFHPVLPIVAAAKQATVFVNRDGINLFNTKTFIATETINFATPKDSSSPYILTFAGNGRKLIYGASTDNSNNATFLKIVDVPFTKKQEELLEKANAK